MQFKSLPNNEKPRERLKLYGKENLSNEELLQILIKCGSRKYSVKDISISILSKVGDLSNLKNYTLNTLQDIEGMSEIKSLELLAALELGRRVYAQTPPETLLNCTDPETIITYFHDLLKDQNKKTSMSSTSITRKNTSIKNSSSKAPSTPPSLIPVKSSKKPTSSLPHI